MDKFLIDNTRISDRSKFTTDKQSKYLTISMEKEYCQIEHSLDLIQCKNVEVNSFKDHIYL